MLGCGRMAPTSSWRSTARERGRAPLHLLDGVVSFGWAGASPALMAACAEAGITLSHLAPNGRFLARVEGPRSGNVLLRRTQYRVADDPARARPIVRAVRRCQIGQSARGGSSGAA